MVSDHAIQLISAGSAVISALSTIALVIVGTYQLRQIARQLRVYGDRERKWNTIKICDFYATDSVIQSITRTIWTEAVRGTDYTAIAEPTHDIISFLNYLEGIAIGVHEGVYVEAIVRDNFEDAIYKAVLALIRGESGTYKGITWKARHRLFRDENYPFLTRLFNNWFGNLPEVNYRDIES